ncbi:hypothetical protein ACTQ3J_00020 [Oscillospiraceae bacterium LCP25S3_E3]|nr:hypothetical protein [Ruminococcus sp.]
MLLLRLWACIDDVMPRKIKKAWLFGDDFAKKYICLTARSD